MHTTYNSLEHNSLPNQHISSNMASQLSLQGLNFSSSLLSGSKPQSTETYPMADISYNNVIALPKDKEIRLSSGNIIKIKPKKQAYSSLLSDSTDDLSIKSKPQHLGLIDIDKLYSKLQVEKRVSEQQPDSYKPLENKFKRNSFKLWVEKYRPSSFLDLIGNERTNRLILQWLNQWNPIVFNKDGPNIKQQQSQYEQQQQQNNKTIDPFQRPDRKILLIHGPPGIGKTSIAHVIAKQLKYEIHEINASDERAGSIVKDKIKNSMKNVNLSGKPTCLILDEIDGATESGFIHILLDLLNEDKKATATAINGVNNNNVNAKKVKKGECLKRPIIAICNDAYSPVLEKLKPYCEIIPFKKSHNRLIQAKLKQICQIENLLINDKLLDALIESTDGDLRNCINYLQFNSSNDEFNIDLENSSRKDSQISWFIQLNSIFIRSSKTSKSAQFNSIFKSLSGSSQLDKVINGCFNYMIDQDTSLEKLSSVSDWLYFQDILNSNFSSFDSKDLGYYQSSIPMKFYQTFNELGNIYDNKSRNYRTKDDTFELKKQVIETLKRLKQSSNFYNITNEKNLITFELSLLSTILVPNTTFKQLELSGSNNTESKLKHILELIDELNLRVDLYKDDTYSTSAAFRPPVNLFTSFNNKQIQLLIRLHKELLSNYQVLKLKQEKERELTTRKRKIHEANDNTAGSTITHKDSNKKASYGSSIEYFRSKYEQLSEQLSHKDEKGGNQGGESAKKNESNRKGIMSENDYRIWVKYHEGFSNAVRKEITWDDLFS